MIILCLIELFEYFLLSLFWMVAAPAERGAGYGLVSPHCLPATSDPSLSILQKILIQKGLRTQISLGKNIFMKGNMTWSQLQLCWIFWQEPPGKQLTIPPLFVRSAGRGAMPPAYYSARLSIAQLPKKSLCYFLPIGQTKPQGRDLCYYVVHGKNKAGSIPWYFSLRDMKYKTVLILPLNCLKFLPFADALHPTKTSR